MWTIVDGAMTNEPHGNNLVSKEKFKDFRIDAEYKVSPKGNSGIYLRGRYEMQVLDDAGPDRRPGARAHVDLLGQGADGQRQQAGRRVADGADHHRRQLRLGTLNGQKIHDNSKIAGVTGGALDAKETEPGPIMIQGDHEKVWFRKVVVTPIRRRRAARRPGELSDAAELDRLRAA